MALTVGDRDVRPLTADEVLRMVEAGILADDEPVELLHGVLTAVSATTPGHEAVKMRLNAWLAPDAADGGYAVRVEAPLTVPDRTSLPEPDVAVVPAGDYLTAHPAGALLVVEVAVSSVRVDTKIKPALYAEAGVPELWVVDLPDGCVHVFTAPRDGAYARHTVARSGARLRPHGLDVPPLDVGALLAGT